MSAAFFVDGAVPEARVSAIVMAEERRFAKRTKASAGRGARHPFFEGWCGAVVARQGGAGERCGGRRASYAEVAALGFGIIDLHVVGTADGVAIVFPDAWLDDLTNSTGPVSELSAAEIADTVRYSDTEEPLERLDDVLSDVAELRCNIVVRNRAALEPLKAIIGSRIRSEQVCLSAKCPDTASELRRLFPEAAQTLAAPELVSVALSGRWPSGIDCAQAPTEWRPFHTDEPSRRGRLFGSIRVPLPDALLGRVAGAAERSGAIVLARTVDDPARARRLLRYGVDGLLSDHPTVIRAAIDGL